jgi:hypothetical protein
MAAQGQSTLTTATSDGPRFTTFHQMIEMESERASSLPTSTFVQSLVGWDAHLYLTGISVRSAKISAALSTAGFPNFPLNSS